MANHLATDALRRNFPSLASLMPISNDGVSFRIMAEGPTDLLHLRLRSIIFGKVEVF